MRWKHPPINSTGFLAAALCLESLWVAQTFNEATTAFRIAAIGLGFVFGIISWRSFRLFGFKIN